MACVYEITHKDSPRIVRYVGITKHDNIEIRMRSHLAASKRKTSKFYIWLRENADGAVITKVTDNLSWDEACLEERTRIAELRNAGVNLLNSTNGGDGAFGVVQSEEHRAKISSSNKGRVFSEEHRANLSKALKGKPLPEKTREKMSAAAAARWARARGEKPESI